MKEKLEIQGVMTSFPHSIGIDQTLQVAKQMMQKYGVRHLPVQDGGRLVGILSNHDIDFALAVDDKKPEEILVEATYTAEPYVVELTADVATIANKMAHDHISCALVMQREKLVGIFTTVDVCRTLAQVLRNEAPAAKVANEN